MVEATAAAKDDDGDGGVVIYEGRFSWIAAASMMIWVLAFIVAVVFTVLAVRDAAFELIAEDLSYIVAPNPPYGPEEQPQDAPMREINKLFRWFLPQTALFYALAATSIGLFTASYFASFMLLEDQGAKRVVDIGLLVTKGVNTYLERSLPLIWVLVGCVGIYVWQIG